MANKAKDLIEKLTSQGYSDKQIASKLGSNRDARYIGLIREEKRSGASFIPAFERMVKGESETSVPRRTTKSGKEARVRGSYTEYDDNGRVIQKSTKTPNGKQVEDLLTSTDKNDGLIGVVVHLGKYKSYHMENTEFASVHVWSHGTSPKWVKSEMSRTGLTFQQLVLREVKSAHETEVASNIQRIDINVMY